MMDTYSHLHTIPPDQLAGELKRLFEQTTPGRAARFKVADFRAIAHGYLTRQGVDPQALLGGAASLFDADGLVDALRQAGFVRPRPWADGVEPFYAAVEVTRPDPPLRPMKTGAILSSGNLGYCDYFDSLVKALAQCGIPWYRCTGAEWGPTLEQGIEKYLEEKPDLELLLVMDHDSVFLPEQVRRLVRLAAEYPEFDAIAPIQVKRGTGQWLFQPTDLSAPPDLDAAELLPIRSAHFGLTVLRVAGLRRMPHPWFFGQPGADGRWRHPRPTVDGSFWEKWNACGLTLALATRVAIGHLELTVSWPGARLGEHVHQYIGDYHAAGVPLEARQ